MSVQLVTDAFECLGLEADGLGHVGLDLWGLTFMDATGLREMARPSTGACWN